MLSREWKRKIIYFVERTIKLRLTRLEIRMILKRIEQKLRHTTSWAFGVDSIYEKNCIYNTTYVLPISVITHVAPVFARACVHIHVIHPLHLLPPQFFVIHTVIPALYRKTVLFLITPIKYKFPMEILHQNWVINPIFSEKTQRN